MKNRVGKWRGGVTEVDPGNGQGGTDTVGQWLGCPARWKSWGQNWDLGSRPGSFTGHLYWLVETTGLSALSRAESPHSVTISIPSTRAQKEHDSHKASVEKVPGSSPVEDFENARQKGDD